MKENVNRIINIWRQEIKLSKEEWICFLVTFFTGSLVYYQMPANWLTNPDTVWNAIYYRVGHGGEKVNGRLFQIAVDKLRMNMVTPVMTTLICILLIAAAGLILGRILESSFVVRLLSGFLLLFVPCTSSSLTYYYCSDSFFLALFLVLLGSYLIKKYPSPVIYFISVCLFTASLYLYQAYICVVFTLAMILLILGLLQKETPLKKVITEFVRFVLTSGAAALIYIVTLKALQIVLHMKVRTDRGLGFTNLFGDEGILSLLGQAYVNFFQYLFGNQLLNNRFGHRYVINLFVLAISIGVVIALTIKNQLWKQPVRFLLLILGLVFFPLAVEAVTVMSPEVDHYGPTGIIMVPTFVLIYLFALVLGMDLIKKKQLGFVYVVTIFSIGLFLWHSLVFTNLCINSMKLNLNKAQTVADLMFDTIVEEYGYEKGSALLVAGSMEDGNFPSLYDWPTEAIQGTSASYGFMWDTYTGNENCWVQFFKQYLGVSFRVCEQEEYEKLLDNSIYKEMPIFPEKGSVKKFGDMIVVKMSNKELE